MKFQPSPMPQELRELSDEERRAAVLAAMRLAAMRRHPSSQPVRYCVCAHAEQHHDPTCDVRSCICDGFSEGKR